MYELGGKTYRRLDFKKELSMRKYQELLTLLKPVIDPLSGFILRDSNGKLYMSDIEVIGHIKTILEELLIDGQIFKIVALLIVEVGADVKKMPTQETVDAIADLTLEELIGVVADFFSSISGSFKSIGISTQITTETAN